MKIGDVKIGMNVVYDGEICIVEEILNNYIYLSNNDEIVFPEEITLYIKPIQSKRVPLSEMPQEEFDELVILGYEVEYRRLV